jgi:CRP-like cAMP-binding protein
MAPQNALRHIVSYEEEPDWNVKSMGMFRLQAFLRALKEGTDADHTDMAGAVVLAGRAGKVLIRAGEPATDMYILASGYARTFVGDAATGRTTGILKGPAVLGDRDLLRSNGRNSTESVQLLTNARLIGMHRTDFVNECERHPTLRDWLARDMAGRFSVSVAWFELESGARAEKAAAFTLATQQGGLVFKEIASLVGLHPVRDDVAPAEQDADSPRLLVHSLVDESIA